MVWATVSSRSCFCWLYRASPSLASKNIINLISVLTIWRCPCVEESSLVLLEEGVCYDQCVLLGKLSVSLCPASFCTPRPNLPVTSGISWLSTFAFQSPMMERTSFPTWDWKLLKWKLYWDISPQNGVVMFWAVPWGRAHRGLGCAGPHSLKRPSHSTLHCIPPVLRFTPCKFWAAIWSRGWSGALAPPRGPLPPLQKVTMSP